MKIVTLGQLQREAGAVRPAAALTIGVFDSVHLGHQRLLREVVDPRVPLLPVVCTFRQNPGSVLGTRRLPGSVLSFRQKMERLEALGVAEVVLIDFSPEISKLTGKKFVDLLEQYLSIRKLVVGYNFHMGKDRDTGVEELRRIISERDTELVVVPATVHDGRVVSSSRVRHTIREGDFGAVQVMMGQPYCVDLRGVSIQARGSRATVRREALGQILPEPGEYSVTVRISSGRQPARLSVGEAALAWARRWQEPEDEICFC